MARDESLRPLTSDQQGLVIRHMWMVPITVKWGLRNFDLREDDIEEAAMYGLVLTGRAWRAGKGAEFATYAVCAMRGQIMEVNRRRKCRKKWLPEDEVGSLTLNKLVVKDSVAPRVPDLTPEEALAVMTRHQRSIWERVLAGEKASSIAKSLGVCKQTVYTVMRLGVKTVRQSLDIDSGEEE